MKNFQLNSKKLKSEKGSITLFVLTTMLFLLGVLIISYMGIRGKLVEQEKQIKKIQEEYNTVDIDSQYYETVQNLGLDLQINLYYADDTNVRHSADKWTNRNLTAKVIWPEDAEDSYKEFYIGEESVGIENIENTLITEYKEVKATYKTKSKTVIAKIDKDNPSTVDISSNNFVIITDEDTAMIEANITAEDHLSGIKEIKYFWSESNTEPTDDQYQTIGIENEEKQIEKNISIEKPLGTYYLWVIAIDNAGNETNPVSKQYKVTDSLPPT